MDILRKSLLGHCIPNQSSRMSRAHRDIRDDWFVMQWTQRCCPSGCWDRVVGCKSQANTQDSEVYVIWHTIGTGCWGDIYSGFRSDWLAWASVSIIASKHKSQSVGIANLFPNEVLLFLSNSDTSAANRVASGFKNGECDVSGQHGGVRWCRSEGITRRRRVANSRGVCRAIASDSANRVKVP